MDFPAILFHYRQRNEPNFNLARFEAAVATTDALRGWTFFPVTKTLEVRGKSVFAKPWVVWAYAFYRTELVKWLLRIVVLTHLLLTLFEPPLPTWELPKSVTFSAEILIFCIYLVELWMVRKVQAQSVAFWWQLVSILLNLIITIIYYTLETHHFLSMGRIFRVFFLVWRFQTLRQTFVDIAFMLPRIGDILFVVMLTVLFFAMFCFPLFYWIVPYRDFRNIFHAFVSLFVLLTTANYPDVMLPAFKKHWFFSLIFVTFLVLTLYILFNLLTAVVVSEYRKRLNVTMKTRLLLQRSLLAYAFRLIHPPDRELLSYHELTAYLRFLRPGASPTWLNAVWQTLDEDQSGFVSRREFFRLPNVYRLKVKRVPKKQSYPIWQRLLGHWYHHPLVEKFKALIKTEWFALFFDSIQLLSVVLLWVKIDSQMNVQRKWGYNCEECEAAALKEVFVDQNEMLFAGIFLAEILLYCFGYGFKAYLSSPFSAFDALIVVVNFLGALLFRYWCTGCRNSSNALHGLMVVRQMRLLRFVVTRKRFQTILASLVRLIPSCTNLGGVLLCIYYTYAIIGMAVFGELFLPQQIQDLPPAFYNTTFHRSNYELNNFHNLPNSFLTLFELMVVNNWQVTMEGYMVAVDSDWAAIYFFTFYLIVVVVALNLLVAFVLDVFDVVSQPAAKPLYSDNFLAAYKQLDIDSAVPVDEYDYRLVYKQRVMDLYWVLFTDLSELLAKLDEVEAEVSRQAFQKAEIVQSPRGFKTPRGFRTHDDNDDDSVTGMDAPLLSVVEPNTHARAGSKAITISQQQQQSWTSTPLLSTPDTNPALFEDLRASTNGNSRLRL